MNLRRQELSARELLNELSRQQVNLYADGDILRFRAPKDRFTEKMKEQVKSRKAELLHVLLGVDDELTISRIERTQPLPMSFAQQRIWFQYQFEGPSSTYNITPVFRLLGQLSVNALHQAFNALAQRHETLRMHFADQNGSGVQIIEHDVNIPIELIDLQHLPTAERMPEAEHLILKKTAEPFKLEKGPLLRVSLLQLDKEEYILLPFMHHIIADGWSLGVLHRELGVLYQSFTSGKPASLDPLPIQYPDFALWQRNVQEADNTGLDYWREQLAGAPQILDLPVDFARPATVSFNGRVLRISIPSAITKVIQELGQAHGCSLFMTLLTAYAVLLHRHCGQDDILIGCPIAGRPVRETEGLIGCFVNTLILRIRLQNNPGFVSLLKQVRQTALDAYSHENVPVESVIEAILKQRNPSMIPLFQAQFSLQNVPIRRVDVSGLIVEVLEMNRVAAKNDLSFILDQREDGIHAELEYNTDLFKETTIRSLGNDYQKLLAGAAATPDCPILDLPMASATAADELNDFTTDDDEEKFNF